MRAGGTGFLAGQVVWLTGKRRLQIKQGESDRGAAS